MKKIRLIPVVVSVALGLSGCSLISDAFGQGGQGGQGASSQSNYDGKGIELAVVAGSELKPLEPILAEYGKGHGVNVKMTYQGSLDTMNTLRTGQISQDAVWLASSIWAQMGDTKHILSDDKSISTSPVVYGIKESKAKELGLVDKQVKTAELVQLIRDKKLKFSMTSATQSNSGATAYLSTLKNIAGVEQLQSEDLQKPDVTRGIRDFLSGVNRSSTSSGWLADSFPASGDEAMVNYESTILDLNQKLVKDGKEPLRIVYPVDGVGIADAPLAFVDHNDEKKKQAFIELQKYLLSDEGQAKIQRTGRRSSFNTVTDEQAKNNIFKPEWGVDTKRTLTAIKLPNPQVIEKALDLYQAVFRKPSDTYYILDTSGSMGTKGMEELSEALSYVMVSDKAAQNKLQATAEDETHVTAFSNVPRRLGSTVGPEQQNDMWQTKVQPLTSLGATATNATLLQTFDDIEQDASIKNGSHIPAIVLFTDGADTDTAKRNDVKKRYQRLADNGMRVPIFFILISEATKDTKYMDELAKLSNGRVFDGSKNLMQTFQTIKGYN